LPSATLLSLTVHLTNRLVRANSYARFFISEQALNKIKYNSTIKAFVSICSHSKVCNLFEDKYIKIIEIKWKSTQIIGKGPILPVISEMDIDLIGKQNFKTERYKIIFDQAWYNGSVDITHILDSHGNDIP
jgi:hypothetical protein